AIAGSATYRERVALSRSAQFDVALEEISRADAPAKVIAHMRISNPGQVPISFNLSYDPRRGDTRRNYVVRATIHEGGVLRFAARDAYPVLTRGHGRRVNILMRQTRSLDGAADPGR